MTWHAVWRENKDGDNEIAPPSEAFLRELKRLLDEAGGGVNAEDRMGRFPLLVAAELPCVHTVGFLLREKADINKASSTLDSRLGGGQTSLMTAVLTHSLDMVQFLLDARADPSIVNRDGLTALDLAVKEADEIDEDEIVPILQRASAPAAPPAPFPHPHELSSSSPGQSCVSMLCLDFCGPDSNADGKSSRRANAEQTALFAGLEDEGDALLRYLQQEPVQPAPPAPPAPRVDLSLLQTLPDQSTPASEVRATAATGAAPVHHGARADSKAAATHEAEATDLHPVRAELLPPLVLPPAGRLQPALSSIDRIERATTATAQSLRSTAFAATAAERRTTVRELESLNYVVRTHSSSSKTTIRHSPRLQRRPRLALTCLLIGCGQLKPAAQTGLSQHSQLQSAKRSSFSVIVLCRSQRLQMQLL